MLGRGTIAVAARLWADRSARAGRMRRAGSAQDGTERGSSLAGDARLSPRRLRGPCPEVGDQTGVSIMAPGSGWGALKSGWGEGVLKILNSATGRAPLCFPLSSESDPETGARAGSEGWSRGQRKAQCGARSCTPEPHYQL